MYCNHRNERNPGACNRCWQFGIVIWSLMLIDMTVVILRSGHVTLQTVGLLGIITVLIVHSILTKWRKGDS